MIENPNSVQPIQGTQQYHVGDILARPWLIFMLIGSVFIVIGTAVELSKSRGSSLSEVDPDFEVPETVEQPAKSTCCQNLKRKKAYFGNLKSFCQRLPRRFWNFFIESFLVPSYRAEWGKYKTWDYRAPERSLTAKQKASRQKIRHHKRSILEANLQFKKAPHPVPHPHKDCSRIKINVGGLKFETQLRTLERYPKTLLGDPVKRQQYFDPVTGEYYFDRCRNTFEIILYYYQSGGRLIRPDYIPSDVLHDDAVFFELDKAVISKYLEEEDLQPDNLKPDRLPKSLLRRKIWLLFDYPESSVQAGIITFFSTFALFLSIGILCIETLEIFYLKALYGVNKDGTVKVVKFDRTDLLDPFFLTETACNAWFILEYLAKLVSCPSIGKYIKSVIYFIDLIAILPFAITVIKRLVGGAEDDDGELIDDDGGNSLNSLTLLRIVRIVRVFRIFKMSRQFKGLEILGKTLKASLNELILLIFFIILGVILFSSTMYFAELGRDDSMFESIPGGFWWALITLTTVGYGDVVPRSPLGKLIGAVCAVAGVLVIALPVPVIVSNFKYFYHQAVGNAELKWYNVDHVENCPYRSAGYNREKNSEKPGKSEQESKKEEK